MDNDVVVSVAVVSVAVVIDTGAGTILQVVHSSCLQ